MSAASRPFDAREYMLAGCGLALLESAADARELAEMLAGLEPWHTLGYTANGLAHYLTRDDPGLHRYRILEGIRMYGVVCLRYPWLRGPYIELIGFAPAGQGQGFGGDVIAWIEEQVRGEATNLWALVSSSNEFARCFYEKYGFLEIARLPELVAPGNTEILLRKRL